MNKIATFALTAVALAAPAAAYAGTSTSIPVVINAAAKYAEGALGSARNTADVNQFMACSLTGNANGTLSGGCYARDANNVTAYCTFTNKPALAAAVQSLNGDSHVRFTWVEVGSCATIVVTNSSHLEPKI